MSAPLQESIAPAFAFRYINKTTSMCHPPGDIYVSSQYLGLLGVKISLRIDLLLAKRRFAGYHSARWHQGLRWSRRGYKGRRVVRWQPLCES
jgi:hypothetical protein